MDPLKENDEQMKRTIHNRLVAAMLACFIAAFALLIYDAYDKPPEPEEEQVMEVIIVSTSDPNIAGE